MKGRRQLVRDVRGIVLVALMMAGCFARAQQTPLYNQYFLNPYLYNPATVGLGEEAKAYFLYRRQWIDIGRVT